MGGDNVPRVIVKQCVNDIFSNTLGNSKATRRCRVMHIIANNFSDSQNTRGSIAHYVLSFGWLVPPKQQAPSPRNTQTGLSGDSWPLEKYVSSSCGVSSPCLAVLM